MNWDERVTNAESFNRLKELMLENLTSLSICDGVLPLNSHALYINGSYVEPTSYFEFINTFDYYEVKLRKMIRKSLITNRDFQEGYILLTKMRKFLRQKEPIIRH